MSNDAPARDGGSARTPHPTPHTAEHEGEHRTEHRRVIAAPAPVVYELVADVTLWPVVFGPTVHVHHLRRAPAEERFELWATVNGEVSQWTSRRTLDAERMRVAFAREVSRPPIARMGGEWRIRALPDGRTEAVLLHHFTPAEDTRDAVRWIESALDANSDAELGRLAQVAEPLAARGLSLADVAFSFTDTRRLDGDPAAAYAFLERAELWPERLPHVARVRLDEPSPGIQRLEMDTETGDGEPHTTSSLRVCRRPEWISYKQQLTPRLLLGHSGLWTVGRDDEGRAVLSSRHTVLLDPEAVAGADGAARAAAATTRDRIRQALGHNSAITMAHAGAEAAREAG